MSCLFSMYARVSVPLSNELSLDPSDSVGLSELVE